MSCKMILVVVIIVKNPDPEDPALVSSHKGVMDISLHMVGRLEYWNIGPKIGTLPNWEYQNAHVSYESCWQSATHHSITPSFHYSRRIIFCHNHLFATPAMGNRFLKIKKHATAFIRIFIHVKKISGKLSPAFDRKPSAT